MQSRLEFFEAKLPKLIALLDEISAESGIYGVGVLKSYYFSQPSEAVVSYFEKLAAEGVTEDDFIQTVGSYINLDKFKPAHLERVKEFIGAFIDVASDT